MNKKLVIIVGFCLLAAILFYTTQNNSNDSQKEWVSNDQQANETDSKADETKKSTSETSASSKTASSESTSSDTAPETTDTKEQEAKKTASDKKFTYVADRITLKAEEYKYIPSHLEIPVNTEVKLTLANEGVIAHNLHIVRRNQTDKTLQNTETIQSGNDQTLNVKFSETGYYDFFCKVAGHKQAGMKGVIHVVEKN